MTSRSVAVAISIMPLTRTASARSTRRPAAARARRRRPENAIVSMPIDARIRLTNSAKLSARDDAEALTRRVSQSSTDATAAPTRPMSAERRRSACARPAARNASASIAAMRRQRRRSASGRSRGSDSWLIARSAPNAVGVRASDCAADAAWSARAPAAPVMRSTARTTDGSIGRRNRFGSTPIRIAIAIDRHDHRPLARRQVRQRRVLLVGHRPVVHALEHPEHVDRRQDHAGRGERRQTADRQRNAPSRIRNSPTKPFRPGSADRRQRDEQERGDQLRRHALQPAVLRDQPRVAPIRQHADDAGTARRC